MSTSNILSQVKAHLGNTATAGSKTLYVQATHSTVSQSALISYLNKLWQSGARKTWGEATNKLAKGGFPPYAERFLREHVTSVPSLDTDQVKVFVGTADGWPLVFQFNPATDSAEVQIFTNGRLKKVGKFALKTARDVSRALTASLDFSEEENEEEEED